MELWDMPVQSPSTSKNSPSTSKLFPENFKILDGRRCNLGIYLMKMKLLIGLKNAGFLGGIFVPLKEKLKKSKLQSKCHNIRTDLQCHGKH
jgi:hypothetical protein